MSEIFYHDEEIKKPEKQTFGRIGNIWVLTEFFLGQKNGLF